MRETGRRTRRWSATAAEPSRSMARANLHASSKPDARLSAAVAQLGVSLRRRVETFAPIPKYRSARIEYMWYQPWQAGYHDILKRGFPKPTDDQTILAELRSPNMGDFLHGGTGEVPFLVGDHAREAFERSRLTGFEFGPVVVAKIATKGMRRRETSAGEPEDAILKSRGVPLDCAPSLHAVRVSARTEVLPDYESGKTPVDRCRPFASHLMSWHVISGVRVTEAGPFPHGHSARIDSGRRASRWGFLISGLKLLSHSWSTIARG